MHNVMACVLIFFVWANAYCLGYNIRRHNRIGALLNAVACWMYFFAVMHNPY